MALSVGRPVDLSVNYTSSSYTFILPSPFWVCTGSPIVQSQSCDMATRECSLVYDSSMRSSYFLVARLIFSLISSEWKKKP